MEIKKISVIGIGYVGLTSAVAFSNNGFTTICTDTAERKVYELNKGIPPFFEPGLEELVKKNVMKKQLVGTTDNIDAVIQSDISFICVGTPALTDGSTDLSAIRKVSEDIGIGLREKKEYHVVVVKSTIPPGTTEEVILPTIEKKSNKKAGKNFGLCMNPEFLKQGSAVQDSLNPDRIVIGEYDVKSGDVLEYIYNNNNCPKIRCGIKAAELIKYASNSLLATKITFANEFSRICEQYNIDVYEVMKGVGLDSRINPKFLNAGCGFGGSCFPKDVSAIVSLSNNIGVETPLMDAVLYTNDLQPMHFIELIKEKIGSLNGQVVAFLGLSFKPNTDDVRETRALPIIQKLVDEGAKVKAFDPKAISNFKMLTNLPIKYYENWEDALKNADFAVIQSDWKEIKEISANDFKRLLKEPILFDGRRTFNPEKMISENVRYYGIGWKNNK